MKSSARLDSLKLLTAQLNYKVRRAIEHGESLANQIQGWLASEPIKPVASIADDRLSWEMRVSIDQPIPFGKWANTFGDAVHNLRSALDNLAWGLACLDGQQPADPTSVYFPVVEQQAKWASALRKITYLPAEAQAAIEALQPFQRSGGTDGEPQSDPLLLLARLSNIDKHRFAIAPTISAREISHSCSVDFGSDEAASKNVPPQVTISVEPFEHDTVLLRQDTTTPIVKVHGSCDFKGQVVLIDDTVGQLGVTTILAQLATYVPQVIVHVLNSVPTN